MAIEGSTKGACWSECHPPSPASPTPALSGPQSLGEVLWAPQAFRDHDGDLTVATVALPSSPCVPGMEGRLWAAFCEAAILLPHFAGDETEALGQAPTATLGLGFGPPRSLNLLPPLPPRPPPSAAVWPKANLPPCLAFSQKPVLFLYPRNRAESLRLVCPKPPPLLPVHHFSLLISPSPCSPTCGSPRGGGGGLLASPPSRPSMSQCCLRPPPPSSSGPLCQRGTRHVDSFSRGQGSHKCYSRPGPGNVGGQQRDRRVWSQPLSCV